MPPSWPCVTTPPSTLEQLQRPYTSTRPFVPSSASSGIRIRHAGSGRAGRGLWFPESLENLQKREIISIAQVVNFAEFHVVEARRVFEQVHDADGMSCLPAILERDFRSDILQPGVKIDLSFFLQFQQGQRDKCLADRAHAEFRVATDGTSRGNVCLADSTAPENLAIRYQRYSCSRQVLFVENILHCFL